MSPSDVVEILKSAVPALINAVALIIITIINSRGKESRGGEDVSDPIPYWLETPLRKFLRCLTRFLIVTLIITILYFLFSFIRLNLDLPTNKPLPTPTPTSTPAKTVCDNLVSRIHIGDTIRVANTLSNNLNFRKVPGLSSPKVTSVKNGTNFVILDGPVCIDTILWWEAVTLDGRIQGWIGEVNNGGFYYLEPIE